MSDPKATKGVAAGDGGVGTASSSSSATHLPPHPDQDSGAVQEALNRLNKIRKMSLTSVAPTPGGVPVITPGGPGSQSVTNSTPVSRANSKPATPGEPDLGYFATTGGDAAGASTTTTAQPNVMVQQATPGRSSASNAQLATDGSTSLADIGLVPVPSPGAQGQFLPRSVLATPGTEDPKSPLDVSNIATGISSSAQQVLGRGPDKKPITLLTDNAMPSPANTSFLRPGSMTPIVAQTNPAAKYTEGTGAAGMGEALNLDDEPQGRQKRSHRASNAEDQDESAIQEDGDEDENSVMTPEEARARSAPSTPHFGAQTGMLKTLDESTKLLRQNSKSRMTTRAPSVSGIGNLVEKPDYSEAKIVVAMVGLPARGKSYLSNKLMRYLRWLEYKVEVFNVGQLRRSRARDQMQATGDKEDHSASYFSHSNQKASALREQLANDSLDMLITWLKAEGNVGIHDATNSTRDRRAKIQARVAKEPDLQLLFLESFCDDAAVIASNVALKVSSGDPDYAGMSREEAEKDFRKRIQQYESVYQTITENHLSYCRILNVGKQVVINRIDGYLQSRIAFYLMNLHLKPRSIYLSRHGESMHNVGGMIGGDSPLSPRGERYAAALPALVLENIGDAPLTVWTSTLQRTVQTARFLPYPKKTWKSLDELDAGVCDGMTYEEIAEKYPEDYESRDDDKFNYRYRGGESYRDVVVRLEPVIMELERQDNILIICHQAIIRCLYGYFMGLSQEEIPYIKVPLHTLIKLTPKAYGCHEERYPLPIAAVDTHRPKPAKKSNAPSPNNAISPPAANTGRDYFGTNTSTRGNTPVLAPTAHPEPPTIISPQRSNSNARAPSGLRNETIVDEEAVDGKSPSEDRQPAPPSQAAIAAALQAQSGLRPIADLAKYEDFATQDVTANLCTAPTENFKLGQNARKICCSRESCGSVILSPEVGDLVVGEGSYLPQDPKAPFGPDPAPETTPDGLERPIFYWHVPGSPFAFDNIGFTRTTAEAKAGSPKIKWLICAECDLGPLGWCYEGGKEAWLAPGRVRYETV